MSVPASSRSSSPSLAAPAPQPVSAAAPQGVASLPDRMVSAAQAANALPPGQAQEEPPGFFEKAVLALCDVVLWVVRQIFVAIDALRKASKVPEVSPPAQPPAPALSNAQPPAPARSLSPSVESSEASSPRSVAPVAPPAPSAPPIVQPIVIYVSPNSQPAQPLAPSGVPLEVQRVMIAGAEVRKAFEAKHPSEAERNRLYTQLGRQVSQASKSIQWGGAEFDSHYLQLGKGLAEQNPLLLQSSLL